MSQYLGLKNLKYSALENIIIGGFISDRGLYTVYYHIKNMYKVRDAVYAVFLPRTSMPSKIAASLGIVKCV